MKSAEDHDRSVLGMCKTTDDYICGHGSPSSETQFMLRACHWKPSRNLWKDQIFTAHNDFVTILKLLERRPDCPVFIWDF